MDEDILQEFLTESWENLGRLDSEIVELEKSPGDEELLKSIFRTIHTIKGTCGFIGLVRLGAVAHSTEEVLGCLRDGLMTATPSVISLVLEGIDRIKELLEALEATGEEPPNSEADLPLISQLDDLAKSVQVGEIDPQGETQFQRIETESPEVAPIESSFGETHDVSQSATNDEASSQRSTDPKADETELAAAQKNAEIAKKVASISIEETSTQQRSVADLSIRVHVDVLDSLMNLVGELVLTRNQLMQMVRDEEDSQYLVPVSNLNRVTTDLQEGVMKTRMQPIGNAWSKLPRLVRDLSQITSKKIDLEMSGAETEIDRTVLDAIRDPLTHMVRNSADHGIELPEVRKAAGKPETGIVELRAFHEGGHVVISLKDDGGGIRKDKLLKKAIDNKIITDVDTQRMSEQEVLSLIFHPGFSTAETVSSVSGRGVGMDVVKTQIERIGGTVELNSEEGVGTTIRIKIPLTLAIISALVVESGGECFAIPQLGVVELVRLAEENRSKIEKIHQFEVFRLRDRLLPLIHLNDVLGLTPPEKNNESGDVNIVVVQVGDDQLGLIVSEVFDTEEIVVKPVGKLFKDVPIYQGTTILGDGRVIMILDVAGIAGQYQTSKTRAALQDRQAQEDTTSQPTTTLLLFESGAGIVYAVPLSLVSRLEEFQAGQMETNGQQIMVQYRNELLPLMPLADARVDQERATVPVVVFSDGRHSMGLIVNQILDIVDEPLVMHRSSHQPGTLGSAIIAGRATEVLDTQFYMMQAHPDWFGGQDEQGTTHVLVVDDSPFFRQLATTAIGSAGHIVHTAGTAEEALNLLGGTAKFDVIFSELKLPGMDGFKFAKSVRETAGVPLVALTARRNRVFSQAAMEAGFDQFLTKFDSREVLDVIEQLSTKMSLTLEAGV